MVQGALRQMLCVWASPTPPLWLSDPLGEIREVILPLESYWEELRLDGGGNRGAGHIPGLSSSFLA